jgi:K(+)-stimulated pyrophosphate-energized sodium pump
MLSIVGMIVSNDAYGPIVDNARGLAKWEAWRRCHQDHDELDSAGNTVKAVTKGFAISAAGLTVIALLGAFLSEVNTAAASLGIAGIENFDIMNRWCSLAFWRGQLFRPSSQPCLCWG